MLDFSRVRAVAAVLSVFFFAGCSSVTFTPAEGKGARPAKPDGFEVKVLGKDWSIRYEIIGTVSCQDSARSSIWNWWTDQQALIMKLKDSNRQRLVDKTREAGGDALIGLNHSISTGGSGGLGVGLGVGIGNSPVGVGVGTSLFAGNPTIRLVSHGRVGVIKQRPGEGR